MLKTQPITNNIPSFVIEPTEYANNVPHIVTVRPAAIPDNLASDLSIAGEIAGVIRREVQHVVGKYNGWTENAVNSKTQVILNATNITNGGSQTMDTFISLQDLKPQDILDILDKISYLNVGVFDVEWRLTIVYIK